MIGWCATASCKWPPSVSRSASDKRNLGSALSGISRASGRYEASIRSDKDLPKLLMIGWEEGALPASRLSDRVQAAAE